MPAQIKPRTTLIAVLAALTLLASSCGTSNEDLLGDSFSTGQSTNERFCELAANTPSGDDFQETLVFAVGMMQLLPADAPTGTQDFLQAAQDAAALGMQSGGDIERLDVNDLARANRVMDTLDSIDVGAFDSWLFDTCGTTGVGARLHSASSDMTAASRTTSAASSSAAAAEPTATAPPLGSEPTPTPADSGLAVVPTDVAISVTLADQGHSGIFRDREMTIDRIVSTNATYESYFSSSEDVDEAPHLMIHMFSQTNAYNGDMPRDRFSLVNPQGRSISADKLFTADGSSTSTIRLDSRDSADFVIAFETSELLNDLGGWTLQYGSSEFVREPFPLSDSYERPYPINLPAPDEPHNLLLREFSTCDNYVDARIVDARIDVEAAHERSTVFTYDRSAAGTRFVDIDIDVSNDAADDCEKVMSEDYGYGWRLIVDGRPFGFEGGAVGSAQIGDGVSRTTHLRFEVPTTAQTLELVDESDALVATWNVSMPEFLGEG